MFKILINIFLSVSNVLAQNSFLLNHFWPLNSTLEDFAGDHNLIHSNEEGSDTSNFISNRFGYPSGALKFDGEDFLMDLKGILIEETFTISVWLKLDEMAGARFTIVQFTDKNTGKNIHLMLNPRPNFTMKNSLGNLGTLTSNNDLITGEWVHLVVTFENDLASFYINGESMGISKFDKLGLDLDEFKETPLIIGQTIIENLCDNSECDMKAEVTLSDLKIFGQALNNEQIFNQRLDIGNIHFFYNFIE